MINFHYSAISRSGEPVSGETEQPNEAAAIEFLRAKGYLPVRLEIKTGFRFSLRSRQPSALKAQEILSIISALSELQETGVSLEEALTILTKDAGHSKKQNNFIEYVTSDVASGKSLSAAFLNSKMLPAQKAGPIISLIRAGENSGELAKNLSQAARLLQNDLEAQKKLQSALSYPLVVLFVAFFTLIFMGAVIAPAFQNLFVDLGKELPSALAFLIAFTDLVPLFLTLLLTTYFFAHFDTSVSRGLKLWSQTFLFKMPFISSLIVSREMSNFSFLLSNLLRGGLGIVDALQIARGGVRNQHVLESIKSVCLEVENGRSITSAFVKAGNMPDVFVQMVRIGEANGTLPKMLHRSADILRRDTEKKIEQMTAYLPAVLICLLGGIIGLLVSSIFGAILDVNDLAV